MTSRPLPNSVQLSSPQTPEMAAPTVRVAASEKTVPALFDTLQRY